MTVDDRPYRQTSDVVAETLGDVAGLKIIDLGAGTGAVTSVIASLGADVTGLEPNQALVDVAREKCPSADFVIAPAELTGLESGTYDVAVFSMSLHHSSDMDAAICEARRIVKPGGRILVIEPESEDPMAPVMRFIDDESRVLMSAQKALANAVSVRDLDWVEVKRYWQKYRVASPQEMIDDLTSIDSTRALKQTDRGAFDVAFTSALAHDEKGPYLPFWCRADLFACKSAA